MQNSNVLLGGFELVFTVVHPLHINGIDIVNEVFVAPAARAQQQKQQQWR